MRLFVQFRQVRGGYLHAQFPDGKVALGKRPRSRPFVLFVRKRERAKKRCQRERHTYSLNQHAGELFSISKKRERGKKNDDHHYHRYCCSFAASSSFGTDNKERPAGFFRAVVWLLFFFFSPFFLVVFSPFDDEDDDDGASS